MIKYTQTFRNMFTPLIAAVVASMVTSSLLEMAKSFAVSRDWPRREKGEGRDA